MWAESLRTQVSTESWGDRVRKMAEELSKRTDSMSSTNSQIDIVWQGEKLELALARKRNFLAQGKNLFVADPHFGKAATFRKVGIPVSEHTTEEDCNRLLQMMKNTGRKTGFFRDFLHARQEKLNLFGHYYSNGERCVPMSKLFLFEVIMTQVR